jgi:hypothetical protein
VHGFLVARALYQLDRSALGMRVLPLWISEVTEGAADPRVKIIARPFYLVALAPRIRALEPVGGAHIEKKREIGYQATSGEPIGGAHFGLGQSATGDLIRIRREEKPVDQHDLPLGKGGHDLAGDQLGARRHEQERFGRGSDFVLLMKHDIPDVVPDPRATRLAYRGEGDSGRRQARGKNSNLRCLSRAFSSLEDDQLPPRHAQDSVMIGLAAPFFMPSMIH